MADKPAVTQGLGKTGSASIVKQGHTATTKYGSNPDAQVKGGRPTPRDLSAK